MYRALSKSLRFPPAHHAARRLTFSSIREGRGPFATQDQPMPTAPCDDANAPISKKDVWARELSLKRQQLELALKNSNQKLVKLGWKLAKTKCLEEKGVLYEKIGEVLKKQKEMKSAIDSVDSQILLMTSEDGSGGSDDNGGDINDGDSIGGDGSGGSDGNRAGIGTA